MPGSYLMVWQTDNPGTSNDDQIELPLVQSGNYDFTVDWGDGTQPVQITAWDQPEVIHTYADPGTYTVEITGQIEGWSFDNDGDAEKLVEIGEWGELNLGNEGGYFWGASNLEISATDVLDLTGTTNLTNAFRDCTSLTTVPSMNEWDVSAVTDMLRTFMEAENFNQDIGGWDVGNVTSMEIMFANATSFNQDIGDWEVGNVTTTRNMFLGASSFNQDIIGWDTSNVENMRGMFSGAESFDQDLGGWDISSIDDDSFGSMRDMFLGVTVSTENYDSMLNGWAAQQEVPSNVTFGGGNSQYSEAGEVDRDTLTNDHDWNISDGGLAQ